MPAEPGALVNGDGARPAIPTQRHEAPVARPDFIYPNRNWGERLWARLEKMTGRGDPL